MKAGRLKEIQCLRKKKGGKVSGGQLQTGKNLGHRRVIFNEGDDRQIAATVRTMYAIDLIHRLEQSDVAKLMKDADIFLAPSVPSANEDQEGTPTVLIEAQASELPVLNTFHGGIPELVQDGASGFLVPESYTVALAKKLEY